MLEILIAEIEILQQTSRNIKEIAPEVAEQLQELRTTKITVEVNPEKINPLLENHKQMLQKAVVIPKWFLWVIIGALLASVAN